MGSKSHHITPLVINSLGGGHTHTHAYIRTETILRNQARAWFKNIANPKIQYNYSNNNCIPELFTANSCWNGVNILLATSAWYISYIPQFESLM